MIGNKWTLCLLREDAESVRQFSLSKDATRTLLLGACVLILFLATATAFLVADSGARVRARLLAEENTLLKAEVEQVRSSVEDLDEAMELLAERDRAARAVAGLLDIDQEVFEVGVGGPGLESPGENGLALMDPEMSETAFAVRYDLEVLLRKAELLERSFGETEVSLREHAEALRTTPIILPTLQRISSPFAARRFHPVRMLYAPHNGLDQSAPTGTPFVATADGVVTYAGWKQGFGNTIEIDHGNGIETLYAHASRMLVRTGQRVSRSEVIGHIGCTGVCTAPHVHYEVHVRGRPVNPTRFVLSRE